MSSTVNKLGLKVCLHVCVLQASRLAGQEKNLKLTQAAPLCFLTYIKVYTNTHRQASSVSYYDPLFLLSHTYALPPCFRFHRTRSPGDCSHYRHVNHFHHGHRHRPHHHVLHPEGQTQWPGWDILILTHARTHARTSSHVKGWHLCFMTFLICVCVCVCVCSMLFWTSCEGSGSSDQQTGRQERCAWWDMTHTHTHTHMHTHTDWIINELTQHLSFLMASCLASLTNWLNSSRCSGLVIVSL